MRVLFLDFDGVLNTAEEATQGKLDDFLVVKMGFFCLDNNISICFSTAWRNFPEHNSPQKLEELLKKNGFPDGVDIIGQTPNLEDFFPKSYGYGTNNFPLRGMEIKHWLENKFDVNSWVAVDDIENHFLDNQKNNLVITNPNLGITDEDFEKISLNLNRQENIKKKANKL